MTSDEARHAFFNSYPSDEDYEDKDKFETKLKGMMEAAEEMRTTAKRAHDTHLLQEAQIMNVELGGVVQSYNLYRQSQAKKSGLVGVSGVRL